MHTLFDAYLLVHRQIPHLSATSYSVLKLAFCNKFDMKFVFFPLVLFVYALDMKWLYIRTHNLCILHSSRTRGDHYPSVYMLSTYNMTNVNYIFLKIYFVRRVTGSSVWQSSFSHY